MITPLQKAQLISFMSGEDLSKCRLYPEDIVVDEKLLQDYVARLEQGEPLSRITGKRWFWRDEFFIADALEPRQDSETLIEAVLQLYPDRGECLRILDIGTGSGCLLLSLLREYGNACGLGVDVSESALATAWKNAQQLGIEAEFQHYDLYSSLPEEKFDIIVSNPPYIRAGDIAELEDNVKVYDPHLALDGGEDGLDAYRAIFEHMPPFTHLFLEIGQGQESDIADIAKNKGFALHSSYEDLSGIIRIIVFK